VNGIASRAGKAAHARRLVLQWWRTTWQSRPALPARPQRPMLQARPVRRVQSRSLCLGCFQPRPNIAFLDSTPVCIVCMARSKRQAVIDERLQQHQARTLEDRRAAAAKGAQVRHARGKKPQGITINRKRAK
jgi:hypothetical protein